MGHVAAVFDVDQTLVRGHTERLFFLYLLRQGRITLRQAMAFLSDLATRPQERFRNKTYLKNLWVEDILTLARQCYRQLISPRLSRQGLACVRQHQQKGHGIILLTGSLNFLMLPLQEDLGADWLIATELANANSRFTGEIAGLHPRGKNKGLLLQELSRRHNLDLLNSYAYGDHLQDISLFHSVGYPVAVNPSWRLKRLARKHCWPICYF
jgi:HAD superfamily hydrolase (TIGR01490 family)